MHVYDTSLTLRNKTESSHFLFVRVVALILKNLWKSFILIEYYCEKVTKRVS